MGFALRFDFRNPESAGTTMADRYAAALDMAEWADGLGCARITVSEHHGSADGYLPSPVQMLAAMAARTKQVRFLVAALIAAGSVGCRARWQWPWLPWQLAGH
ncbi:LLM class flavin-dependent oxidoreductase [Streptomyces sp. NPDC058469]|uniref:LLM class flavin-dependent oxidoreductase n=1 Tax=Streptomyces sp. NPDC058469 TaxID=3346514 RepID=UPI0036663E05